MHEGVPEWLQGSLRSWLNEVVPSADSYSTPTFRDFLRAYERVFRVAVPPAPEERSRRAHFLGWIVSDAERLIDLLDYCLATLPLRIEDRYDLARALHEGGSVWRLTSTGRGLEKIIDETAHRVALDAVAIGGRPAEHLKVAYEKAWGRVSDPSGAYREAVRAVEAVLRPIVEPKNPKATLGSMSAVLRNAPRDFRMRLQPGTGADPIEMFRETLALLWTSQLDRHGTDDESVPLMVDLGQAQDAVALASQVVHLVQTGGFVRREAAP